MRIGWPFVVLALAVCPAWAGGTTGHDPAGGGLPLVDPATCPEDAAGWEARALARSLAPQPGLPPIPHPADNPPSAGKIALGRKLFFDRRLSINGTMSCAMCHVPEQAFVNRELATAVGVEGRSVKRNAPTLINVAFHDPLFHDGRDNALETQFIGPLVARNEMANPSAGRVIARINAMPEYRRLFDAAFAAPASLDRMGMALATYQRSLVAGGSDFDRWYYGGDETALTEPAKRGFALFSGAAGCTACHPVGADSAILTDNLFHDTGYGWMREQVRQHPPATAPVQVAPGVVHEVDFARIMSVSAPREADLGRYEVTETPADRWRFRTPSLRNVALTPPYMHDGALASLRAVLEFYDAGGPGAPGQDPRIRPLGLSPSDLDDLEAFLNALTSPGIACLAKEARSAPPDNH